MISAPWLRVLSILIVGASDGITMTAGMPSRLAAMATPWAWLPDEKATTPAFRSWSDSCISRLVAPLSLKAPPVCRHSHFSHTRAPPIRPAMSGVCSTSSSMRLAAAMTSSRVTVGDNLNSLIMLDFRQTVANWGQITPDRPVRVQYSFTWRHPDHISRCAAPWDFQPQGSFVSNYQLEVP